MIKISIIVAAYNIENYIRKCIESVVSQLTEETELIVVNDGSTDNTSMLLTELQKKFHFHLVNQSNKGLSGARNSGIKVANGKYLWFIDGDDWITDNALIQLLPHTCFNYDLLTLFVGRIASSDKDIGAEFLVGVRH